MHPNLIPRTRTCFHSFQVEQKIDYFEQSCWLGFFKGGERGREVRFPITRRGEVLARFRSKMDCMILSFSRSIPIVLCLVFGGIRCSRNRTLIFFATAFAGKYYREHASINKLLRNELDDVASLLLPIPHPQTIHVLQDKSQMRCFHKEKYTEYSNNVCKSYRQIISDISRRALSGVAA